jgi:hypothetical protein
LGVEALDQHSNTRENVLWLKTIYQSLGIKPDLRPDFNGNDIGKRKRTVTMATWNVQECRGKIQEMIKEMEQLRIDIASITETKKKGS